MTPTLVGVIAARAQQPARPYRIGFLETTNVSLNAANMAAFHKA